jgi:hypothetical protein
MRPLNHINVKRLLAVSRCPAEWHDRKTLVWIDFEALRAFAVFLHPGTLSLCRLKDVWYWRVRSEAIRRWRSMALSWERPEIVVNVICWAGSWRTPKFGRVFLSRELPTSESSKNMALVPCLVYFFASITVTAFFSYSTDRRSDPKTFANENRKNLSRPGLDGPKRAFIQSPS